MLPAATLELSDAIRARTRETMPIAAEAWAKVGPGGDWARQWLGQVPRLVALVGAAQVGAATDGAAVVPAGLAETGFPERAVAKADPAAFTGWVNPVGGTYSVPLERYLFAPLITARMAKGEPEEMLAAGGLDLANRVHYAVADAAGQATGVQITGTERTAAVWYDPPPYCQRCAVLIGKRVSVAFQRHPRCDGTISPKSTRDRSPEPVMDLRHVKDLTDDQRRAIADGADPNQVINVKNRVSRDGVSKLSRDGSTSGGILTPRGIYAAAAGDRDRALALLRKHRYLT